MLQLNSVLVPEMAYGSRQGDCGLLGANQKVALSAFSKEGLLMGIELYKTSDSDGFNDVVRLHCEGGLIALSVRYLGRCDRDGSHGYWHC